MRKNSGARTHPRPQLAGAARLQSVKVNRTASKPKPPPTETQAWEYALHAVSARAFSAGEMRTRLRRRQAAPEVINTVMAKLAEYGYLDDAALAGAYASARKENQGHGRERVLRDLRQRQVPAPVAEAAVAATYEDTDETQLIAAYLARKFRGKILHEYLAEPSHLASAFRRLRYAGFSASNSIKVLRRFSHQADELETEPDLETGANS
jgi:regulatory protein